ncbi:MAG TPA: DinB family protein [Terriglobales bacterium]|nr:DinB family protein [Terriglobales bacterium]
MDNKDFLRMFAYDSWANRECLAAMRAAPPISVDTSANTVGRMAHILSAQKLWLERILKQPQSMPVWPTATIADCMALADEMSSRWRNYLTQLAAQLPPVSLDDKAEYRNSKGELWSSRVEDILTHVLFHSAYHRGQIALQMRAAGFQPAYTDFIHAVRQGFVE